MLLFFVVVGCGGVLSPQEFPHLAANIADNIATMAADPEIAAKARHSQRGINSKGPGRDQ